MYLGEVGLESDMNTAVWIHYAFTFPGQLQNVSEQASKDQTTSTCFSVVAETGNMTDDRFLS